jgi:hypothetical protein
MSGRRGFAQAHELRGAALALFSKHESQETCFTKLGIDATLGLHYYVELSRL